MPWNIWLINPKVVPSSFRKNSPWDLWLANHPAVLCSLGKLPSAARKSLHATLWWVQHGWKQHSDLRNKWVRWYSWWARKRFLSETLQQNKMILNNCLFAIAKLYSRIVLRNLTKENSAIFRTVERNYKKLDIVGGSSRCYGRYNSWF